MYLVGSVALRMMALIFLFPVLTKVTLALVRPGYFDAVAARKEFAFLIGIDTILVIIGVSLLFRSTAQSLLGQDDAGVVALVRTVVVALLSAGAIVLALHTLRFLGVIDSLRDDGIVLIASGYWLVFFTACVFPGWYCRRLGAARAQADAPAPVLTAVPHGARFLHLPTTPPAKRPAPSRPVSRAPETRHMGVPGWAVTILLVAFFAVLTLGGMHGSTSARFLPTDAHLREAERLLSPLGTICAGLLVLAVFVGPRPSRRTALGSPFWRTVIAVAVFYFGFYVGAAPALRLGLPDYMAQFGGGTPVTVSAEVVARGQDYVRHRCNRTARVRMDVGQGARDYVICDVPDSDWRRLARGQRLNVSGILTPLGFRYDMIRRP